MTKERAWIAVRCSQRHVGGDVRPSLKSGVKFGPSHPCSLAPIFELCVERRLDVSKTRRCGYRARSQRICGKDVAEDFVEAAALGLILVVRLLGRRWYGS